MSPRIGIDLGGTKIAGIGMAHDGTVLAELRVATPRDDYAGTVEAVAELVARLESALLAAKPLCVGIGTPGSVVPGASMMQNCNSGWLNGRPLRADLEARLGRTIRIANDADCFALSEARDGAGAGFETVFGVILGTGVGGGLVIRGRLLGGPNALTGEWGHTCMPGTGDAPGGTPRGAPELAARLPPRRCYCGARDCIETYLSGPGLATSHRELWGEDAAPGAIARAATDNTRRTRELYTGMLARALAQVIDIVDPHVIVLGGGLSNMDSLYRDLPAALPQHVFGGRCVTPVVPPRWGDASGVRGAAALWDT